MIDSFSVLDRTHWAELHDAYGVAEDAPELLADLLGEEPDVCGEVLAYLDTAVLHQGTLCSVTAPCALFVAGVLDDPRTMIRCVSDLPWDDEERPLRVSLLDWLARVAAAAARWDGDPEEMVAGESEAAAACRAIRPDVYAAVRPLLDDEDEAVRKAALDAVGHLLLAPELAARQEELALRPASRGTRVERATAALVLGEWGRVPGAYLDDEDALVRAAAALAPALDADPAALAEVRRALSDPAETERWPAARLPLLAGKARFALIRVLLRRTATFEEILPEALAVMGVANAYTVDSDWGPLLARAFAVPHEPGRALTVAQREFLTAIVDCDACWGGVANPMSWFIQAGLPYNRAALRELLG